jgi:hypothetical protein
VVALQQAVESVSNSLQQAAVVALQQAAVVVLQQAVEFNLQIHCNRK